MIYGSRIGTGGRLRSVIEEPEETASGNVVLRVGKEQVGGYWTQTEYVVLEPEEAREYGEKILAITGKEGT